MIYSMKTFHGTQNWRADCIEKEGFQGSELSEFTCLGNFVEDGVVFVAFTYEEAFLYGEEAVFEIDVPAECIHPFSDGNTDHGYITLADLNEYGDWTRL